jgi:hypothetical protein
VPQFPVVKNLLVTLWQAEGNLSRAPNYRTWFIALTAGSAALACAGCAADGGTGTAGAPKPTVLTGGQTCQSIRADLVRLDKKGVQALVERQNSGKQLTKAQKAQADLYNQLLNDYLGARCHV